MSTLISLARHNTPPSPVHTLQRAANTTYAVEGISMVSAAPADAARRRQTLLNADAALTADEDVYTVSVPPHTIWWLTPEGFHARYGVRWSSTSNRAGQIAAIHVLAEDLDVAATSLAHGADTDVVTVRNDARLVVAPTGEDGVLLIIRAYPLEQW